MLALRCLGLLLLSLWFAGCARCSDEPRVPFKLPKSEASTPAPPPLPEVRAGVGGGAPARTFTPPVDSPLVGGAALALTRVHALLEADVDSDGDTDVLALHEDETHGLSLSLAARDGATVGAPRALSPFHEAMPEGCSIASAELRGLSTTKAIAIRARTCSTTAPSQALTLLSLEPTPRLYERIEVLPSAELSRPLALAAASRDVDGDGHDDVVITVRREGTPEGDSLPLIWLDRPSGLVRDLREPEATLAAWAGAAQSLAAKVPDQASARAELGLALARAVCREHGATELMLSGALGVPCGAAHSTTQLLSVLVSARARRGEVAGAFAAYRELARSEPRAQPRTLEQAGNALGGLKPAVATTLRVGPAVEPVRAPRVHLPSARFVSESLLYINRIKPALYELDKSEESAAPSASDSLLRDPSGQLAITALERTCEGIAARIERAPPRGSEYVTSPALSSAVLLPLPSPPGCTRGSARPEDFGYRLLGWAPQGIVAVRGNEVRLAPLGQDGRPSGPPRALAPDAPRPAPLALGSATADGARYVEATSHGVLVYGPSSDRVELWRPEGYSSIAKEPLEAAISPSARRVAVVSGGTVYVLERK